MKKSACDSSKSGNMIKFKKLNGIEIKSDKKNLSLIRVSKGSKMVCGSICQSDCSCFIFESINNNICKLYNETAMAYLIEKNAIENQLTYFKE